MFDYHLFNIRSLFVDIIWTIPERLNGLNLLYFIKVYVKVDKFKPELENNLVERANSSIVVEHNKLTPKKSSSSAGDYNYFQYSINHLIPYTQYYVTIQACNQDLFDTVKFYCLAGIPKQFPNTQIAQAGSNNYIQFITSQDKPDLQQSPILITVSSSTINVRVDIPLRPNGIILLFEIWIADAKRDKLEKNLACVIEDLYDPNDFNSVLNGRNKTRSCSIGNLQSSWGYMLSATSSTVIGRSQFSSEIDIITLEKYPSCHPKIDQAISYKTDSIYFEWSPSLNASRNDSAWIDCIGGTLKNFTIYELISSNNVTIIYTGLGNSLNLTGLNSSTKYFFRIELCNSVGCASTDTITIETIDPPPNPWSSLTRPRYLDIFQLIKWNIKSN